MIVGVRHAAVWNPDSVVYARLPGFHLSERGAIEVRSLAERLRRAPIRAVYASPLERAQETGRELAEPHGLAVSTEERLQEWSFWTRWEGVRWDRIRERDPALLDVYANDPEAAGDGDTLSAVAARVLGWAEEAERRHPEGIVLGVTHESPLVAASLVGAGRSLADYHSVSLPHLATVRLQPRPAEVVDLVAWASRC
jgi:broad specificity phosphatase PhoE